MKKSTSWENEYVIGEYQKELILPNLLRLMEIKKGEAILDVACGPGFFANEFFKKGARVVGVDISEKLVNLAKKNYPKIDFRAGSADNVSFWGEKSFDKAVMILAIQNIEKVQETLAECAKVLKPQGKLFIVMTHPAFRALKESSWGWDDKNQVQYRRMDKYLSESKQQILMHPSMDSGQFKGNYTTSFNRPLQYYFKAINKAGMAVGRLEEWNSHRKSEPGPRAKAEDIARREIPMFLMMEIIKLRI